MLIIIFYCCYLDDFLCVLSAHLSWHETHKTENISLHIIYSFKLQDNEDTHYGTEKTGV